MAQNPHSANRELCREKTHFGSPAKPNVSSECAGLAGYGLVFWVPVPGLFTFMVTIGDTIT